MVVFLSGAVLMRLHRPINIHNKRYRKMAEKSMEKRCVGLFLADCKALFVVVGFGCNQTKLSGYFSKQGAVWECMVEIYHEGDLTYITNE
jgi:hypothetical protein